MKNAIIHTKFVYYILFLLLVLNACQEQQQNKVGVLLHEMEGRWFNDIEYLKQHADDMGVDLVIKTAGGDENKQLQQARELVDENVRVMLVVAVNQNTAAGIVRTAHDANIQVVGYDRLIMNSDLDYYISYEYEKIGRMLAEYAHDKVPRGNYVMLWGDAADNNARLMSEGQNKYLQEFENRGEVNVIYRTYVDGWLERNARFQLQKVIDYSDKNIDVILANNDNIALEALSVIDDNNLPRPEVITGQDAIIEACRSIMNKGQTMTVYKSMSDMARQGIQLAVDIINNNDIDYIDGKTNNKRIDVPTLFMPPQVIDKDNLVSILVDKDHTYSLEELKK
ncbi:MAG: substrate-binding domain-containing protein [Prolixibacteraceae bacterium]|jgi:D-xylose transport system substrate-binding protein|nr:substrate-binding domain-containing protein [Prolixibacteraceae bacterium]